MGRRVHTEQILLVIFYLKQNKPELGLPHLNLLTKKPAAGKSGLSDPTALILTYSFKIKNRRNKHDTSEMFVP